MPKPLRLTFAFFSLILAVLGCEVRSAELVTKSADPFTKPPEVRPIAQRQPLQLPLSQPKLVVKKGERQLLLFSGDKLVRTYRVGLGLSPIGDKVRSGDHRTPEGDFYIFTRNDKSRGHPAPGV